jgi:hypothetical protein
LTVKAKVKRKEGIKEESWDAGQRCTEGAQTDEACKCCWHASFYFDFKSRRENRTEVEKGVGAFGMR